MDHRVVWADGNDAPPKPFMAHPADSFVRDDHPPVPAPVPARYAITEQQCGLCIHYLALTQAGHYPGLIDDGICGADAASEV
jgi:hypothetical protein